MRLLVTICSLLCAWTCALAQSEGSSKTKTLNELNRLAEQAHASGDVTQEIEYRRLYSRRTWGDFGPKRKAADRYSRWEVVFGNDLPLGLLLEGTHEWVEAEAVYLHNKAELARNTVAGDDIKARNELQIAQLLTREGKGSEAKRICSRWKNRVKHLADDYAFAAKYNDPVPPEYDTREVEIARWDLACGLPEEGLSLLSEQIKARPDLLEAFLVLAGYYLSEGDFERSREIEKKGTGEAVFF